LEVSFDICSAYSRALPKRASPSLQTDATASRRHESNTTLTALSFGQLVSLCETKRDELQRGVWQGEAGRQYLDFAIALAGLSWPKLPVAHAEHVDVAKSYLSPEKISTVSPSPTLPARWLVLGNVTERGSPATIADSYRASSTTHGIVFESRHIYVICYRRSSTSRKQ
jgi:hypothetical protein